MSKHVVVIGAGVVGLCSAYELVKRGYRVTVLDKETEPARGCSYGNGGIIVPSHFVPLAAPGMMAMGIRMMADKRSPFGLHGMLSLEVAGWVTRFMRASTKSHVEKSAPLLRDMNLASRDIYDELTNGAPPEVGYAKRGLLMLCRTSKALEGEKHLSDDANRLGLHAKPLNAAEVTALEPGLDMDIQGGVYFEEDAHLTPAAFMFYLRDKLRSGGVEIRDGATVTGFERSGSRIQAVLIGQERIAADEVVLASGVWAGPLGGQLGLRLPMLSGKGYGFTVTKPPQPMRIPSILVEGRIAVTPMSDGIRFVGTMELGHPREGLNPNRVEGMKASIPEFYPAYRQFELGSVAVWAGHRPCTPDGLPYLGKSKAFENLVVAAGHAMMGMSLGPITGRLVGQLVAGETPSIPIDLLSPNRYV